MANYGVDIELSVKGLNSLKQLEREINSVEEAAKKLRTIDVSGATKLTTSELERQRKLYQDSGKERRIALILANRELETERKINDVLEKRAKAQEAAKKQRERMESLALGVGFPLLFGGGAGAVVGGAAGSFLGEGFGGQILLSAVGQQLDAFTANVAELGQALDPLTPDIDKIIESTGLLGTQTAAYIKELEDAEDSTLALVAATYELKRIVGKDGVDTLKEFGDVTQDLGNEFQKMMTLAGTALADFLDGPLKSLVQYLEGQNVVSAAAKSEDPKLTKLAEQYSDIFVPSSMKDFPIFADAVKQQQEILNEIRTIQNELAEKEKEKLDTLKETSTARQVDVNLLQAQIDLAKTDGDLTNEAVFNLREKVIEQQTYVRLQDAANNQAKIDIALMQEKLDKQILINQKKEEEARKAERAAREAERLRKRQEEDKRRLNVLLEQTKLAETLLILDRQIATEKMEGNEVTVQALEQEKVLEQLASKITEIKARGLSYDRERLEIILAQIAADKELVAASTQRQDQQKQLTESFTKTLQGLDFQLEKTTAISGSQEDMLRLKELELNYREKGKTLSVDEKAAALDKITKIREATEALAEQEVVQQRINAIVNTAGQQFAGLFETLIKGTNDWNAAISNVLNSLANALIRFGLTALGGTDGVGLFSILSGTFTGGKKALGGQVSPGKTYMVGEKGPELFAPGAKGNIIPNDAMGGSNIVVNVDAGGSNVQGDGNQAKALGAAIGLAVQNEILKQKKPGGLLY